MQESYEELEHTADWAVRVTGEDFSDLFMKSAGAMLDLMQIAHPAGTIETWKVSLHSPDPEGLLVSWLEEFIFIIDTEHIAPVSYSCHVSQNGKRLEGEIHTLPLVSMRNSIKAITFNELNIAQTRDGLVVQIVFDV